MARKKHAKLNTKFGKVKLQVKGASKDLINAAAYQIEALAKVNLSFRDTGFADTSIQAIPIGGSAIPPETATLQDRDGDMVERQAVGLSAPGKDQALVGIAAEYGVILETKQPFLYPAAVEVGKSLGATILKTGNRRKLQ